MTVVGEDFDRLFDLTSDAAFLDVDHRIVRCNDAAVTLYNVDSADELIGRLTTELAPPQHRSWISGRAARVEDGRERLRWAEEEILRPDGSVHAVSVRSCPVDYQGRPAALVLIRPRSDAGQADLDLLHRERRAKLFTEVSLSLAKADAEHIDTALEETLGRIAASEGADRAYLIEFSPNGERLYCTHEWCADGIEPQIDYVQDLSTAEFEWSSATIRRGDVVHVPELVNLPAEAAPERESFGQYGVRSVLQIPLVAGGVVTGLVGFNSISRPVTWSEETIDLVRSVCDAIATAITRRRALVETETAREEAEQANLAKTTFLSRTSHELRTPLNAILGFTELMLLDDSRDQTDRAPLEQVQTSGRHLLGIVEDVLDISRIEAGKLSVSLESVDVQSVVAAAVDMIQSAGLDNDLTLSIGSLGRHTHVLADRQRLQQVLVNILSNACKYNRPGGEVLLEAREHEARVQLVVTDTGIGIAPDKLHRVFEPFDRLGREETQIEGSGIGLTLSRMIVELMGGQVVIESEEGVGTKVSVDLAGATMTASPSGRSRAVSGSQLVLGVEDNEASMLLLEHIVKRTTGLRFVGTSTVAEARALIEESLPDLILLDLHLADGSGEEILAYLRNRRDARHIPVVVVTADTDTDVMSRVISAGAVDFLPKPVAVTKLTEVIERLLR